MLASDLDTVMVDSLKALDLIRPIREADIGKAKPPGTGPVGDFAVSRASIPQVYIGVLRTNEWNFVANSTTDDGRWRKHYAGNHEGKRPTDKSKNKAVFVMLAIGFFIRALVDVRAVEQ